LNPYSPNPTSNPQLTFTGYAYDNPLARVIGNNTPLTDVTINRIASVQYRVDGGTWLDASPVDGAFNTDNEQFTFTTSALANGYYTIEVQATNSRGNISSTWSDTVIMQSPPQLTVSKNGTGSGTVTSNPSGINCGSTCSASFNYNTSVTVTATPSTGSTFTGWGGVCSGTGTCTVTMDAAKSVTASFTLNTYTISGNADVGGVTLTYTDGTVKHVTSASNGDYTITVPYGWSGTVTPSKTGVTFTPAKRTYTNVTSNKTSQDYAAKVTATFNSTGSQDGWILESSETSGVGGTKDNTATTFRLGDDSSDRQYRAILSFNTASLPNNAIIQSAVLKIKQSGSAVGSNPFSILGSLYADIRKGYFGSSSSLQLIDFNAAASASKVGTFGATPVSGWYSATLNSSGRSNINKTSLTQFRLYFSKDDNDNNMADYMKFFSGDASSGKPQLIITYTLP
jgi:hypothetical protein